MSLYYTLKLFLQFAGINCEAKTGRLPCSFENYTQITQTFVIIWYIDDIEANLSFGKIPCVYLHDILKRLLAKAAFDASFKCLFRSVSFCVTLNDLCC